MTIDSVSKEEICKVGKSRKDLLDLLGKIQTERVDLVNNPDHYKVLLEALPLSIDSSWKPLNVNYSETSLLAVFFDGSKILAQWLNLTNEEPASGTRNVNAGWQYIDANSMVPAQIPRTRYKKLRIYFSNKWFQIRWYFRGVKNAILGRGPGDH